MPDTTTRLWFSRKLQDENKKRALAAAIGSAGLALDNRRKQDENRKRAQPGLAGRPFVRRLERLRGNTLLGRLPSLPGFIRGSIISVLVFASYDFPFRSRDGF